MANAPKFHGIIEISDKQIYHIDSKDKQSYCFISCPNIDKKQKKVSVDIESIIVQSLSFYESLLRSNANLPGGPELAIISEHDQAVSLVVVVSILYAFFYKPVPPSRDISASFPEVSRECMFTVKSIELCTTKDMTKGDIRFISSIVQTLCSDLPQLSRGLMQEITKFFLSPNQYDLKASMICNVGSESGAKGTVRSSWDKLLSSFGVGST